jgi:heme/copper-type cytochrome/quinol oxidase subunit 1
VRSAVIVDPRVVRLKVDRSLFTRALGKSMSEALIEEKPTPSEFLFWHVSVHKTLLVTSWLAPFIIMAVGYFFFPPLRAKAALAWQATSDIWAEISLQLVCLIAWLIYAI